MGALVPDVDRAIAALAEETPAVGAILSVLQGAQQLSVHKAYNEVSIRVARQFLAGQLAWEDADRAVNNLWGWLFTQPEETITEHGIPKPFWSIFQALEQGEFDHRGDAPTTDPVAVYVVPMLEAILAGLDQSEPG